MKINTIPLPENAADMTPVADQAATTRIEAALETMTDAQAYALSRQILRHAAEYGEINDAAALHFLQQHRPAFRRPAGLAKVGV